MLQFISTVKQVIYNKQLNYWLYSLKMNLLGPVTYSGVKISFSKKTAVLYQAVATRLMLLVEINRLLGLSTKVSNFFYDKNMTRIGPSTVAFVYLASSVLPFLVMHGSANYSVVFEGVLKTVVPAGYEFAALVSLVWFMFVLLVLKSRFLIVLYYYFNGNLVLHVWNILTTS